MLTGDLNRAIVETLTYSDIFEYPLQLEEVHRYLRLRANIEQVSDALAQLSNQVGYGNGYYFLSKRDDLVKIRHQREQRSRKLLPFALRYGRVLGSLPFIRMVALTGSLAVLNISKNVDFDYMLVTVPGRLWTARAFALAFNRVTRIMGHTLCPNLIVAETALEWPLHDLYSARELCQMVPITGLDVYQKVMASNRWAEDLLPNAFQPPSISTTTSEPFTQRLLEVPLRGNIGESLERWEMTRKIARFSQQEGFGEETVFTADMCQGNFHHHRKWTRDVFERKLAETEAPSSVNMQVDA